MLKLPHYIILGRLGRNLSGKRWQSAITKLYVPRVTPTTQNQQRIIKYSIGRQHGYQFSPEEYQLLDRYEFNGIERVNSSEYTPLPIEIAFSKLQEGRLRNRFVSAELFYVYIIVPLHRKDELFVRGLKANQEFYTKMFRQFCGPEMIDIPDSKRKIMLEKLEEGLRINDNFPDISSHNSSSDDQKSLQNGQKSIELAKNGDLKNLKEYLQNIIVIQEETGMNNLDMDLDSYFEVIYLLGYTTSTKNDMDDQVNMEKMELIRFMISNAPHFPGYFKALTAQINRHIVNEKFDSALVLFEDVTKISHILKTASKDQFIKQNIGRYARKILHTYDDIEIAKLHGAKIYETFKEAFNFYEELLWTILLSAKWKRDGRKRLELLRGILDIVDPMREKIQLVYPLLAELNDRKHDPQLTDQRLDVLSQFLNMGYKDLEDLDPTFMWNNIVNPVLNEAEAENASQILKTAIDRFEKHGLSAEVLNEMIRNAKNSTYFRPEIVAELDGFSRYNSLIQNSTKKSTEIRDHSTFDPKIFSRLVYEKRCGEVLEMLRNCKGFPRELNMAAATEPLIQTFLENARLEEIDEILEFLSEKEISSIPARPTDQPTSSVTSIHLLNVIANKAAKNSGNLTSDLVNFAHRLKEKFPNTFDHPKQYQTSISAARNLFQTILGGEVTLSDFDLAVDLMVKLMMDELLLLHENETISTFIVNRAYFKLGWTPAVSIWLNFQNQRGLSNALFSLLEFSIKNNSQARLDFLFHHARTHIAEHRYNSFLAAAYAAQRKPEIAESIVKNNQVPPGGLVMLFRLWMALHPPDMCTVQFLEIIFKHTTILERERMLRVVTDEAERKFANKKNPNLIRAYLQLVKTYNLPINQAAFGSFRT
ncbi:unnamed protein product [Bursaphelenchus xylophilus]|uniref:(pine wood nematode) hypothetical protein n=1 Tax=Bursaphelenchus xylophilus TaxID=6326 RepID=A0A811JXV3_BURXY|nr:unnamed protein product [Bursaphelenchus xylophilus]CAG9080138.1 unnamed protein product [Bursaphelenchus xylophilus]